MAVPKHPYPIVGGLEKQAHELSKTLVSQGHEVHVLTSLFDASQQARETIDGVSIYRLKWYDNPLIRYTLMITGLARRMWLLRKKIDVVHIHQFTLFGVYVQVLSKLLGLPVITKLPNIGRAGIPGIQSDHFGKLRIKVLKMAHSIIAMTPVSLQELNDIGYPEQKVLKVTNGISFSEQELAPVPQKLTSITEVVFVGRLVQQKGVFTLLNAWRHLPESVRKQARLNLIGDGPLQPELEKLASDLSLTDSVKFLGYSDNVKKHLQESHLFVLSSYEEGNSNAILEAMLAGLPIVATSIGGARIQVGPKGKNFLFNPDDHKTMAKLIQQFVENEALRYSTGKAMRERILEKFSIDRVANTYEEAYRMIIERRSSRMFTVNEELFDNHG